MVQIKKKKKKKQENLFSLNFFLSKNKDFQFFPLLQKQY